MRVYGKIEQIRQYESESNSVELISGMIYIHKK